MKSLVACLLLLLPAAARAQAPLRVATSAGQVDVPAFATRGQPLFPAATLERFGASITADPRGARAILFGDTLRFVALSPFFTASNDVIQLEAPARTVAGTFMLPEQFFIEWLPARYPDRLEYRAGALRLKTAVVIHVPPAGAPPVAAPPAPSTAAVRPVRVVVIDAGHGGRDPGKIGPTGLREKDAALRLANRLAALLRERGYEVHLTRTRDTLIALADRPRIANRLKRDRPALFLSIHLNSHRSDDVQGFETFFLSEARTDDERRVAEMENAAVAFEDETIANGDAVDDIINDMRNDFYVRASSDLAEEVQDRLASFHTGPNRGVKRAGFRVLVGAFMPAVLVEVAFISNRDEARLLGTSAFQQKVTWGLAEAVDDFFDRNQHLWTTGS